MDTGLAAWGEFDFGTRASFALDPRDRFVLRVDGPILRLPATATYCWGLACIPDRM